MEYPAWKKALIEAGRAFGATALGVFMSLIFLGDEINLDLIRSINTWEELLTLLVIPVIAGGIKGVFKYAREKWGVTKSGNKDYDSILYKLPV